MTDVANMFCSSRCDLVLKEGRQEDEGTMKQNNDRPNSSSYEAVINGSQESALWWDLPCATSYVKCTSEAQVGVNGSDNKGFAVKVRIEV